MIQRVTRGFDALVQIFLIDAKALKKIEYTMSNTGNHLHLMPLAWLGWLSAPLSTVCVFSGQRVS